MRKLYHEFFYIPQHGKIREKVMAARVAVVALITVVCLTAMSLTAFAYFSYNVVSGTNRIKAAHFDVDVTVTVADEPQQTARSVRSNAVTHTAVLQPGVTYTVRVRSADNSTAQTGFVIVSAQNSDSCYHTQQLRKGGEATEFYLTVTAETTVTFLAHWGTSSRSGTPAQPDDLYITQGESVALTVRATTTTTTAPTTQTTTTVTATAPTTVTTQTTTTATTAATTAPATQTTTTATATVPTTVTTQEPTTATTAATTTSTETAVTTGTTVTEVSDQ